MKKLTKKPKFKIETDSQTVRIWVNQESGTRYDDDYYDDDYDYNEENIIVDFSFKDTEEGYCCGIKTIGNFIFDEFDDKIKGVSEATAEALKDCLLENIDKGRPAGLITCSLSHKQLAWPEGKLLGEALLAVGFKVVSKFVNPLTKNKITVYNHWKPAK